MASPDDTLLAYGEDATLDRASRDGWVLARDEPATPPRVNEALLTLADGHVGTRGAREDDQATAIPAVHMSGVYTGRDPTLLNGPLWFALAIDVDAATPVRRLLDLRMGTLVTLYPTPHGVVRTVRLASAARPGVVALRAQGPAASLGPGAALREPPAQPGVTVRRDDRDGAECVTVAGSDAAITAVSTHDVTDTGSPPTWRTIDRFTAMRSRARGAGAVPSDAWQAALDARGAGFDVLEEEHRSVWADRWDTAQVTIEGDPEIQLSARFAIFHLLSTVASSGESAVGARGLSGPAYHGHVFWDADVFVLPAVAALHPPAARTMLEYRLRRMGAAQAAARERGRDGARFAWESAGDGHDVTPTEYRGPEGIVRAIRTGELEEHIVADVAWAAAHYAEWTGDEAFLRGPGRPLLTETARYWASRVRIDEQGRGHIDGVIGPDEYHEAVDDNAFTNGMARWNLRAAADLVARSPAGAADAEDASRWRHIADALVDGFDVAAGRHEQFAGYSQLEPLRIAEVAEPPVAADLLLGPARVQASQIIKQADVLMLHHLLPDAVVPGSLVADLDHYLPRTAHGSSLSPAIHASLLARAGRADAGLELLRIACRLDLDDLTDTTAGGLHLAAMGGVWQALVFGFAGVLARDGSLVVDPHLPSAWPRLKISFCYRSRRLTLVLTDEELEVRSDGPVNIRLGSQNTTDPPFHVVRPPRARFVRRATGWERSGP